MDLSTILIPLLIFIAELCVVTLGTLRIIFVARGQKILAPLLGFFESFIWLVAISQITRDHSDWLSFIAFALGFALGNFVGITVEKRLALGTVIVRIITHRDAGRLITHLRSADFGVTAMDGHGATGKVQIVMTVVKRKQLPQITTLIKTYHPHAFYAVDDVQSANDGIFPPPKDRVGIIPAPFASLARLVMRGLHKPAELASQSDDRADAGTGQANEPKAAALR